MKKKFLAILTSLTCMLTAITAILSNGESITDGITITSEHFVYNNPRPYNQNGSDGFYLETDLGSDFEGVIYMVTRKESFCSADGSSGLIYAITPVNKFPADSGYLSGAAYHFPDTELEIGDFLKSDTGKYSANQIDPTSIYPGESGGKWIHLGNGADLLGDDFREVIRREMILASGLTDIQYRSDMEVTRYFDIVPIRGDASLDDTVSILDSIALNRSMLNGVELCDYAKLAGDVNENGALDADDSLMILKETIGLTENFE